TVYGCCLRNCNSFSTVLCTRLRHSPFPYTTLFRSSRRFRTPRRQTVQLSIESTEVNCGKSIGRSCVEGSNRSNWRMEAGSAPPLDRKSTRLNSSHQIISYAVFCLKKKRQDFDGREH